MPNADTIREVAGKLGVPADWLDGVIAFESRYDPQATAGIAYNQAKVSKGLESPKYARGLIQFIDSTAQWLGYASADDLVTKHPDFDSQMRGPVYRYFSTMKPFVSKIDLYMTVFYPAYRRKDPDSVFPDSVRAANPGIDTPADYVAAADAKVAAIRMIPAAGIAGLLIAATALYLFMRVNA